MAEKDPSPTSNGPGPRAKLVIQQCLSAKLQVKPPTNDTEAEFVQIGRGIVLYVCFFKGADEDTVEKMAKFVMSIRLSEPLSEGKWVCVLDLPGSILVVPQATLGGKPKGRAMQYHSNVAKEAGLELYHKFVELCHEALESNARTLEAGCTVEKGTYGNRQVLSVVTNGPYTHTMDF